MKSNILQVLIGVMGAIFVPVAAYAHHEGGGHNDNMIIVVSILGVFGFLFWRAMSMRNSTPK